MYAFDITSTAGISASLCGKCINFEFETIFFLRVHCYKIHLHLFNLGRTYFSRKVKEYLVILKRDMV